ncbi:hypothetical protein LINPERHAP2_LOCUS18670, partial [Linum perenne]
VVQWTSPTVKATGPKAPNKTPPQFSRAFSPSSKKSPIPMNPRFLIASSFVLPRPNRSSLRHLQRFLLPTTFSAKNHRNQSNGFRSTNSFFGKSLPSANPMERDQFHSESWTDVEHDKVQLVASNHSGGSLNESVGKEVVAKNWSRLIATISCVKLVALQGWGFEGHDETASPLDFRIFIKMIDFKAELNADVRTNVLDSAPSDRKYIYHCR